MERMALQLAQLLRENLVDIEPKLRHIPESDAAIRRAGGTGWSRKQEIGHLIDSATNNRVRFLFAALDGSYTAPSYNGNGWVDLGGYVDTPWVDLVELWLRLNQALARSVERIPDARLNAECRIGNDPMMSLGALIEDYVRHMRHHLEHIVQVDV